MNSDDKKPEFVYVIYIVTTPEKLWAALTDGKSSEQYWFGSHVESDWKVGSPITVNTNDKTDIVGKILQIEPPRILSYTFAGPAPNAPSSRVTFELKPNGDVVKLTLIHDSFDDTKMIRDISQGWPGILSSLKSLLETEHPLPLDRDSFITGGKSAK